MASDGSAGFEHDPISTEKGTHLYGQLVPPLTAWDPAKRQRTALPACFAPPRPWPCGRGCPWAPPAPRDGGGRRAEGEKKKKRGGRAQTGGRGGETQWAGGTGGGRPGRSGRLGGSAARPEGKQAALAARGNAEHRRRVPQRGRRAAPYLPRGERGSGGGTAARPGSLLRPTPSPPPTPRAAANRQPPSGYTLRCPPMERGPGRLVTADAGTPPQRPQFLEGPAPRQPTPPRRLAGGHPGGGERAAPRPADPPTALRGAPRRALQAPRTGTTAPLSPPSTPPPPAPRTGASPRRGRGQAERRPHLTRPSAVLAALSCSEWFPAAHRLRLFMYLQSRCVFNGTGKGRGNGKSYFIWQIGRIPDSLHLLLPIFSWNSVLELGPLWWASTAKLAYHKS